MENSMLFDLPFDPAYVIVILAGLVAILLILVIATMSKLKKLSRKYDYFMRGKDAETLEDVILDQLEEIRVLKAEDRAAKDSIRTLNRNFRSSFQKFVMVRYNAFPGMGGTLSFVFVLLDYTNSGFILNCLHSKEGCYLYMKEVDAGKTEKVLGSEEQEALEQALGYVKKN